MALRDCCLTQLRNSSFAAARERDMAFGLTFAKPLSMVVQHQQYVLSSGPPVW